MMISKFSNDELDLFGFLPSPGVNIVWTPTPVPALPIPLIQGAIYIKDDAATKTNCALLWNVNHVYWRSSRYVTYFQTFQSSITTSYDQDVEYESLWPKLFVDFLLK